METNKEIVKKAVAELSGLSKEEKLNRALGELEETYKEVHGSIKVKKVIETKDKDLESGRGR